MEDVLAKEYPYPPLPTSHGMPEEDFEFWPDEDEGSCGPFEIGK
jgi:hypothetical protein